MMAKKKSEKTLFQQVKEELKKVKWPTKREMIKYTTAVIVFIVIFGLYFFGLDAVFSLFFEWVRGIVH